MTCKAGAFPLWGLSGRAQLAPSPQVPELLVSDLDSLLFPWPLLWFSISRHLHLGGIISTMSTFICHRLVAMEVLTRDGCSKF